MPGLRAIEETGSITGLLKFLHIIDFYTVTLHLLEKFNIRVYKNM
jgi:hypothetical protein